MGLERISALLQGTHDNYQIDHFKTLIDASSNLTKTKVSNENINLKNDENDNVVSRVIEVFDGEILR